MVGLARGGRVSTYVVVGLVARGSRVGFARVLDLARTTAAVSLVVAAIPVDWFTSDLTFLKAIANRW